MNARNITDLRVAYQVLPIELDGWMSNRIDVPEDFVGVLRKSYGSVETFTGHKILPWTISLPYLLGSQVREIGLVRRKFSIDFFIADTPFKEDIWETSHKVVDWHVSGRLILNSNSNSAGKFYDQFIFSKSGIRVTDERVSIFDKEVSLILEKEIRQINFIDQISQITKLSTYGELCSEEKREEVIKVIQQCVNQICESWGAEADIYHIVPQPPRPVYGPSPLQGKNALYKNIKENKDSDKKRFDWISLINEIGNIVQLAQFILAAFALFAGLFGADFIKDLINSSWSLAIAILILFSFSFVVTKPTLRTLIAPREKTFALLGRLPNLQKSNLSTKISFLRPATIIGLGIWSVYESQTPAWPLENSGALLAVIFILLFFSIPDEWWKNARLRLFVSLLPFFLPCIFFLFDHRRMIPLWAPIYVLILTALIMALGETEYMLTITLMIVFSPGFEHSHLALSIPLLIGLLVPGLPERGILSFMAGLVAFGIGYSQPLYYLFYPNIWLQIVLQSLVWSFVSLFVGSFIERESKNFNFAKDFLIIVLGIFIALCGLMFSQIWFKENIGLLLRAFLVNSLWAIVLVSLWGILPRVLENRMDFDNN